jgi:hypothetical protein
MNMLADAADHQGWAWLRERWNTDLRSWMPRTTIFSLSLGRRLDNIIRTVQLTVDEIQPTNSVRPTGRQRAKGRACRRVRLQRARTCR